MCIDESGNPSEDQYFATAACWLRSSKQWRNAAKELVEKLQRWIESNSTVSLLPEIHGSNFPDKEIDRISFFNTLVSELYGAPNIQEDPLANR